MQLFLIGRGSAGRRWCKINNSEEVHKEQNGLNLFVTQRVAAWSGERHNAVQEVFTETSSKRVRNPR